jgi:hypothetical protein
VEPTGIEPVTGLAEPDSRQSFAPTGDFPLAHSLACETQKASDTSYLERVKIDPDLALLVERWDSLPDAVRAGIVAMVKATGNCTGS